MLSLTTALLLGPEQVGYMPARYAHFYTRQCTVGSQRLHPTLGELRLQVQAGLRFNEVFSFF